MNLNIIYSFLKRHKYLLMMGIVGLTLVVLGLTLVPAEFLAKNKVFSHDKIGHLLLFGSWTFLIGIYYHKSDSKSTNYWVIFLIGIAFGIVIELIQYGFPSLNRHADLYDVFFDAGGCLIAIFALKMIVPNK